MINKIIGTLVIVLTLISLFMGGNNLLNVLGDIYYLIAGFCFFKKPIIGYWMVGIGILMFIIAAILYKITSSY